MKKGLVIRGKKGQLIERLPGIVIGIAVLFTMLMGYLIITGKIQGLIQFILDSMRFR